MSISPRCPYCNIAFHGRDSTLANAVGQDVKGMVSAVYYALAVPLAFVNTWFSGALYVLVAILWLIPDRRIERVLNESST